MSACPCFLDGGGPYRNGSYTQTQGTWFSVARFKLLLVQVCPLLADTAMFSEQMTIAILFVIECRGADPADILATRTADDMVAAAVLLDGSLALRTPLDLVFVHPVPVSLSVATLFIVVDRARPPFVAYGVAFRTYGGKAVFAGNSKGFFGGAEDGGTVRGRAIVQLV